MIQHDRGLYCKECAADLEFYRVKVNHRSESEWFKCQNGHPARLTYGPDGHLIGMANVGGIDP